MFAAVPDAPREPVLSSVEEADDIVEAGQEEAGPSAHVLRPEADADEAGGNAPEQGPLRQPTDEPGR
jgi:CPA2 family monovalent cation:H+ antiporter-2